MTEWEGIGLFLAPLLLGATMFQNRSDCLFSKLIMEFLSSTVVILHENQACHQCNYIYNKGYETSLTESMT